MDGSRITFSLQLHVIQQPSIGIFPYCVNKQGITNSICFHHSIAKLHAFVFKNGTNVAIMHLNESAASSSGDDTNVLVEVFL